MGHFHSRTTTSERGPGISRVARLLPVKRTQDTKRRHSRRAEEKKIVNTSNIARSWRGGGIWFPLAAQFRRMSILNARTEQEIPSATKSAATMRPTVYEDEFLLPRVGEEYRASSRLQPTNLLISTSQFARNRSKESENFPRF